MVYLRNVVFGVLMVSAFVVHSAEGLSAQQVSYEPAQDALTVNVDHASLKAVLSRIALLSGMEVLMDPKVERDISIDFEDRSLEQGIKQLVRDLNAVFLYEEADSHKEGEPMLVGLRLLPTGETNQAALEPLLGIESETLLRTMTNRAGSPEGDDTIAVQRWQHRLGKLPKAYRERILSVAQEQRRKLEQRRAVRNEIAERNALVRAKIVAEREQIEERLQSIDPARYELRRQRLREIEQALIHN